VAPTSGPQKPSTLKPSDGRGRCREASESGRQTGGGKGGREGLREAWPRLYHDGASGVGGSGRQPVCAAIWRSVAVAVVAAAAD